MTPPRRSEERSFVENELVTHEILLRGVRIGYFDEGERSRPTVLLLHGLGRSRLQWAPLCRALARHHRVIALDFPGFGSSDGPTGSRYRYSFEALAETTLDLLAALGLGRVALVGHDMGAGVALAAAADRPEFVGRLVLVAPPCFPTRRPLAERLVLMPWIGPTLFRSPLGGSTMRRHGAVTEPNSDAAYLMLRRAADSSTLEARVPRVRCPTLVVWGRDDAVSPWTHGTRLAREISGARLEILECGHDPVAERPLAFESLISEFLAEEAKLSRDTQAAKTITPKNGVPSSRRITR
jgi:pimeloyl-ACP methyl ester carboxylesterase